MSWQAYVDDSLLGTGSVCLAAIYGHDGNVWATSPGFSPSVAEITALLRGVDEPSGLQAGGVKLNGEKYMYLRNDPGECVYFKKGPSAGGCFAKSKQACIIGLYDDKSTGGKCNMVVQNLADYLKDQGY